MAWSAIPDVVPLAATAVTLTECVSLRSTSAKAIEPDAVSGAVEPVVLAASLNAPLAVVGPATMVGWSLVPVTVTTTSCVVDPPWVSATCTV